MLEGARESDLYPAIKGFLIGQGYDVKSEIGAADVVALIPGAQPLVVELKLGFSLALFHQAIARQRITDAVYIAVEQRPGKRFLKSLKENISLARRLGLGLITVRLRDGHVTVHCDPGPFTPRKSVARRQALLREFARRAGDPNAGGQTRAGLTTAYRQDALRIAAVLAAGPSKGASVAATTGIARATRIMADNHHGWFERLSRGVYGLSDTGRKALATRATVAG